MPMTIGPTATVAVGTGIRGMVVTAAIRIAVIMLILVDAAVTTITVTAAAITMMTMVITVRPSFARRLTSTSACKLLIYVG